MKQITIIIDGDAYEAVKGEDECPCGHCDLHELCEKLSMQAIPCLLGMDKVEDLHVVYFEKIRVKDSLYFKRSPVELYTIEDYLTRKSKRNESIYQRKDR